MLGGLPERPLYQPELEALAQGEALQLAFPATPNSIRKDDEGNTRIHDLLLFINGTVAAVAYSENECGWIVITKTDADNPQEAAVDAIIEYREYEIDDAAKVREFVTELYGAAGDLLDET
jgi:hypothetical protein